MANVSFSPTITTFFESSGTLSFCVEVSTGVLQFPLSVVVTSSGLTGIGEPTHQQDGNTCSCDTCTGFCLAGYGENVELPILNSKL